MPDDDLMMILFALNPAEQSDRQAGRRFDAALTSNID